MIATKLLLFGLATVTAVAETTVVTSMTMPPGTTVSSFPASVQTSTKSESAHEAPSGNQSSSATPSPSGSEPPKPSASVGAAAHPYGTLPLFHYARKMPLLMLSVTQFGIVLGLGLPVVLGML